MPDLLHSELETAKRHIGESEFLTDIAARVPAGMLEEVVARHGRYLEPVEGEVICAKGEYGSEVYFLPGGAAWIVISEDFATDFIRAEKGGARRIPERQMTKLITERLEGERGMFFGEVGAATRAPYGATIFASANARLIALNWRGLRALMQISPLFSAAINERGVRREVKDFSHFSHMQAIERNGCVFCHQVAEDANRTNSGFVRVPVAKCIECHNEATDLDSCTTCHNYHFPLFEDILLHEGGLVSQPLPETKGEQVSTSLAY